MTKAKKIAAAVTACATILTAASAAAFVPNKGELEVTASAASTTNGTAPKYIFMFIGDGMSYPQIQATADYYSALAYTNDNDILEAKRRLNLQS